MGQESTSRITQKKGVTISKRSDSALILQAFAPCSGLGVTNNTHVTQFEFSGPKCMILAHLIEHQIHPYFAK